MRHRFLFSSLVLFCLGVFQWQVANAADVERDTLAATYDRPAVEIGGGFADDGGSGDINALMPLIFSEGKDLLFLGADARFSGFNANETDDTMYNVGAYLGYRRLLEDNNGVLGLWAGLDHFNTENSNDFTRAIAGIEYFGPHVIARANGFVPLDSTSGEWNVTEGGFITTFDEKVPSGFDAEIGLRMTLPMAGMIKPAEFRVFAGGYDFVGLAEDGGDVFGGRGRAELDLYLFDEHPDTRLSLQASYAYDKHSGDQFAAAIKLSIPLGVSNKISTHGAKDEVVAELDSFGQDLFQPVRRNREAVSRVRQKNREVVGAGGVGGFSISNVCGGASGDLTLNGGLTSTTVKQGALLGTVDPLGSATPLYLTLANMVAPDGRTLKKILASEPQTVSTTLTFPSNTVNFVTQTVRPAAGVTLTSGAVNAQTINGAVVTINGNTCSLDLDVRVSAQPQQGQTLASICGGTASNINLIGGSGALASSTVKQGDVLGTIDPSGAATPLPLNLGNMVAPDGRTMATILSTSPANLNSTFTFPASTVNFTNQVVRPTEGFALATGSAATQTISDATLTVNNNSCQLSLSVAQDPPPPPSGLTLATICGGPNAQIPIVPFNPIGTLVASTIQQGDKIGDNLTIGGVLNFDLAAMVNGSGASLTSLLSGLPSSLNETLSFPTSVVDFTTSVVQPVLNFSQANVSFDLQSIRDFTVTISGNSCTATIHNGLQPVVVAID